MGFLNKRRVPLETPRHNISSGALHQDGEWLVYSLAIAETNDLNVLLDPKEVAKIAEEYANGGFPLLKSLIQESSLGEPSRRLASDIRRVFGNLEQDITIPYNVTIPEDHTNKNYKDNMKIIERLETKLRDLVEQKLSRINSKWLNDRIPNLKMIEKWEEIRGKSTRSEKFSKGDSLKV